MKTRYFATILCLALSVACASTTPAEDKPAAMETDEQKTIYAIGVALSQRLAGLGLEQADVDLIQRGLADGILGNEPAVEMETFGPQIETVLGARRDKLAAATKEKGDAFVAAEAGKDGAVKLESGALYFETEAGTGATPTAADAVSIHYVGTLIDGEMFDSSREGEGTPATFQVGGVIPCFGEGVQQMKVGGKARLVCPSTAAYGDQGRPPKILPGAALVFDVELMDVIPATTPADPVP